MNKSRREVHRLRMALLIGALAIVTLAVGGCPDRRPPGPVTGFTATPGDAQVVLTWTNPTAADLDKVKILRKVGGFPASSTDGTPVFDAQGTNYTDTTAANGTTYYFAAYAYDKAGNESVAATAGPVTPTVANANADILNAFASLTEELAGPNPLPDPAPSLLEGILGEAESLYRQGLGCEAGALLRTDFLTKAQEYRVGADVDTAERLFNSARMLRFDILVGDLLKAECDEAARIGVPADSEANDPENGNTKLLTKATFGEPLVLTANEPGTGRAMTQVHLLDADADMGDPGAPAVPMIRRLVAIPIGAEFEVEVGDPVVAETFKCNLIPSQPQPVDEASTPGETQPPEEYFGNAEYEKNQDLYASDAPYPPEIVRQAEIGNGRDMRFLLLEIAAGQYNPVTNSLELFEEVPVQVKFTGGEFFGTEQGSSPFEEATSIFQGAVLNSALLAKPEYLRPIEGAFELFGEELLILTHPSFREAADTLAEWKRAKGIATRIYECGTGSGITGRVTASEIDTFIQNHYDMTLIRPSYILLLGDAEFIPPFYQNGIGTDWPYAILGAVGVDQVPDFAVGRIPVDTIEQANAVVTKIINYEKTPPTNSGFYSKAAVASQFQCCRDDVATAGTDWRTFIEVSEFARNVMLGKSKTVDRIYTKTGPAATTPARYFDGTLLPTALGAGSGFAWAGSTANITNAINDGRFLVIHRDHGWSGGWSHPDFESANVDALTNHELTPVIFSVNCSSGYFDNETASGGIASGVYFVEYALRKADGGAVGILGDTRDSPSWPNTALLKGFIDAMWPSAIGSFGSGSSKRRLGDILNHGKLYMMTQIGVAGAGVSAGDATNELYLWHCYGDPTLEIWLSNPNLFALPVHLASVEVLKESLLVGYGTNGAVITALQDDAQTPGLQRIIGRGEVVDGVATLNFVETPLPGYPINYAATFENAVSRAPTLGLVAE